MSRTPWRTVHTPDPRIGLVFPGHSPSPLSTTMKRKRTVKRGREYYEYLKSEAWRNKKIAYLKSALPKNCHVCGLSWDNSFVFHHKTYKTLGNERLMDIAPTCRPCHQQIHDYLERATSPKATLWNAGKRVKRGKLRKLRRKLRLPSLKEAKRLFRNGIVLE